MMVDNIDDPIDGITTQVRQECEISHKRYSEYREIILTLLASSLPPPSLPPPSLPPGVQCTDALPPSPPFPLQRISLVSRFS